MTRGRTLVILFLLVAPVLVFVGVGGWALWQSGHLLWLWLTLPVCWAAAFLLGRLWGEKLVPLQPPDAEEPVHWTPRDKQAWQLVAARIKSADDVDLDFLTKLQFYVDTSRDMAEDIARVYHPKATDPLSSLTIPEIMAAAQLALEDLADVYDQYVPGGDWLTVKNWRSLAKLPKRYRLISNLLTAGAAVFSPMAALGRYAASKTIMAPVTKAIQSNILTWFYAAFLQRVGFYLIEMNSGRLRGGKDKFREAFERFRHKQKPWEDDVEASASEPEHQQRPTASLRAQSDEGSTAEGAESKAGGAESFRPSPLDAGPEMTLCVVGRAASGRSSVVQALFRNTPGEDDADEVTKTGTVTERRLALPATGDSFRVLQTAAYSGQEESRSICKDRLRAIEQSDLVLLVIDVTKPDHNADHDFLQDVSEYFAEKPQLKPPPVIAVLTHVDLLKPPAKPEPKSEEPPEEDGAASFRFPEAETEQGCSIPEAVERIRKEFGETVRQVVPVCVDDAHQRVYGIQEELAPAIGAALEEAHAVSKIRKLHETLGKGKVSRMLQQVWNIGKALRGK